MQIDLPLPSHRDAEILDLESLKGFLKPLLDRKLITTAGRKDVVGKPVLYKTTPEFLLQFGLKDLKELPTLKEFEELRRLAMDDDLMPIAEAKGPQQAPEEVIVEPIVESAESA